MLDEYHGQMAQASEENSRRWEELEAQTARQARERSAAAEPPAVRHRPAILLALQRARREYALAGNDLLAPGSTGDQRAACVALACAFRLAVQRLDVARVRLQATDGSDAAIRQVLADLGPAAALEIRGAVEDFAEATLHEADQARQALALFPDAGSTPERG